MSLELAIAIGGYLAEWGTVKLADRVLTGVNSKLNTQELDKALKAGVEAAHKQEETLFYPCEPHLIPKFLDFSVTMQLITALHPLWGLSSLRCIKRIFTENWY